MAAEKQLTEDQQRVWDIISTPYHHLTDTQIKIEMIEAQLKMKITQLKEAAKLYENYHYE